MRLKSVFICLLLMFSLPLFSQEENIDKSYPEPEVIPAQLSFLTPPDGFVPATDFEGYINVNMGSAILMSVIDNIPYSILKVSMTDTFFVENQLIKIAETPLSISDEIQGVVYKCEFNTQGHDFIRLIVYAGNLTQTLWLNITYPKIVDEQLSPAMMRSFNSINLSSQSE